MTNDMESDLIFREMTLEDIPSVCTVEKLSFNTPWSEESFSSELLYNQLAHYYVLELKKLVVAYGGLWAIAGEGHITNIAVHPAFRGRGYGRMLAEEMIEAGRRHGCARYTLEVRPANLAAVHLYENIGFKSVGIRPKYYQDTGEDALIMWKD